VQLPERLDGEVRFEHLTFGYVPGTQILHEFRFRSDLTCINAKLLHNNVLDLVLDVVSHKNRRVNFG